MPDAVELEPGLRRITAPNPSPMTFRGTNTYLLGQGARAVIDPGPGDDAHLDAILRACPGGISHILVTHAHADHSHLAPALAERCGAPVLAFGPATAGRSEVMRRLAAQGLAGGGEGIDAGFAPDRCLADGETIEGDGWRLRAIWTPGHSANHLCFAWGRRLFSGDHVMGWASSVVSPPDGDMTRFMASCRSLQGLGLRRLFPGHGDPVEDPEQRLSWLIAHRRQREAEILAALRDAAGTAAELAGRIYRDLPPGLLAMAERNVLAHLVDLWARGLVTATPELSATARFARAA